MTRKVQTLLAELLCGDDERAELAAGRLAELSRESLAEVLSLLDSPAADTRWWAVRTLAQMDKPPIETLIRCAEDENEEVRQCGILALVYHPDARAVPCLMNNLMDSEPVTVNLAASALIEIGSPAVPALLSLPGDAPHASRVESVRALASIADERAIPALMKALDEDSPALHYWSEHGLEKLGLGMVYMKTSGTT